MNQIVITKRPDGRYKIAIMGKERTEEVYYMMENVFAANIFLILKKLKATDDL